MTLVVGCWSCVCCCLLFVDCRLLFAVRYYIVVTCVLYVACNCCCVVFVVGYVLCDGLGFVE